MEYVLDEEVATHWPLSRQILILMLLQGLVCAVQLAIADENYCQEA